jgi:hypothetical protein
MVDDAHVMECGLMSLCRDAHDVICGISFPFYNMALQQSLLPCAVQDFPCKYLGLPLSTKKLTTKKLTKE